MKSKLAHIPKIKLIKILFWAIFFAKNSLLNANSSEINLVVVILIPLEATVIPKRYIESIKEKTPTASFPIVLEMYVLKKRRIN